MDIFKIYSRILGRICNHEGHTPIGDLNRARGSAEESKALCIGILEFPVAIRINPSDYAIRTRLESIQLKGAV